MYCNNCGERGHVFKTCSSPIISCGLLLLRHDKEKLLKLPTKSKKVKILMVRRKDSMTYMEFIRGKYELQNIDYIKKLINNMTRFEHAKIISQPFETLWTGLWGNYRDIHSTEYELSKEKYEMLDRSLIVAQCGLSQYVEPEWGFPKGRRIKDETNIECAIREFFEETNILRETYSICENLCFTETFIGTNNIAYKHIYFVALVEKSDIINLKQKFTSMQRCEISAVEWKSLVECRNITRGHYVDRKRIITDLERAIETFETISSK